MHQPNEIKKHWQLIILAGLIVATVSAGITFLWPLNYRADTQVFIISKTRTGVDPYTVVKSAERVGENLVEVMKTDDFRSKVRAIPGYQLDWKMFDAMNDRRQRRAWIRMVSGSVVYGTGMMNVSVYNRNPEMAKQFASAVAQTLSGQAWEYVGADVILKVVNAPIVTRWPVKPNIPLNTLLGFAAGILCAAVFVSRGR